MNQFEFKTSINLTDVCRGKVEKELQTLTDNDDNANANADRGASATKE